MTPSRFDIWAEGRIVKFGDDRMKQDADGDFGVLYLGADWSTRSIHGCLSERWCSTILMTMRLTAQSYEVSGHGWLTGPYATVKLTENLFWQSPCSSGGARTTPSALTSRMRTRSAASVGWGAARCRAIGNMARGVSCRAQPSATSRTRRRLTPTLWCRHPERQGATSRRPYLAAS